MTNNRARIELCDTINCGETARHVVYWPGQRCQFCELCAARAVTVAAAMGFVVDCRALDESRV